MITNIANAQNSVSPADYSIGFDYRSSNASAILYVNDVPPLGIFEDEASLGGRAVGKTQFNLNNVFLPQKNTVRFRFQFLDIADDTAVPDFRFRFFYWPKNAVVNPFEAAENGYAIEAHFFMDKDDKGEPIISFSESNPGQKFLKASKLRVSGKMKKNEWITAEFDFTSNFAFASRDWVNGQNIKNDQTTRQAISEQFRTLNGYLQSKDKNALFGLYEPMMKNQGIAYGRSAEEWFDYQIAQPYLQGDVVFQGFDDSNSQLRIYGNGRLATLDHMPIRYVRDGSEGTLNPFYYLDASGNWQMMD